MSILQQEPSTFRELWDACRAIMDLWYDLSPAYDLEDFLGFMSIEAQAGDLMYKAPSEREQQLFFDKFIHGYNVERKKVQSMLAAG